MEVHIDDKSTFLDFMISCPSSRLLIIYCAEAANIKITSWAHYKPSSIEAIRDPESAISYRLYSNLLDAFANFEGFGAHLIWQMFEVGLISDSEEQQLAKSFSAISLSLRKTKRSRAD
ncbi:MAG: hypothetical protein V9G63_02790 [Candidatus Competibacter sp.]|nr:hypothetical protein [Candidatus Competibacteraceae bacterium]